jgi:hypothetical protein
MKQITFLLLSVFMLCSCASGYKKINPATLNYVSKNIGNNIFLEYKYDLLSNKYKKKETKKEVRLIAVKITNNTNKDLVFGKNFQLIYENGSALNILPTEKIYKQLKQSPASYLLYLLLTPLQISNGSSTNSYQQSNSSFPIGYAIGPGLAGGSVYESSHANKNFKNDLNEFDINGKTIKKGETIYGLIGLNSKSYDAIKVKLQ